MKNALTRVLIALVALAGFGLIVWGLTSPHVEPKLTMPDISATPALATPSPVTATPTATPTPSPVAPSATPSTSPSVTSAPTPSATMRQMADPTGKPSQIVVKSAKTGELLVSTRLVGVAVKGGARWSPVAGRAEWLTSYAKPGVLSPYNAIVAGHVSGGGKPDVFYGLTKAGQGDVVTIKYDNDQVATFVINRVEDPGKGDVINDPQYDWVWGVPGSKPTRTLSLFTCDPTAPYVNGHSLRNIVVQAVRTS